MDLSYQPKLSCPFCQTQFVTEDGLGDNNSGLDCCVLAMIGNNFFMKETMIYQLKHNELEVGVWCVCDWYFAQALNIIK